MPERILAIGLDGFETTVAERLVQQRRMPHLQSLLDRGARVALDHGPAKRTGLAWEHFATGHGPQRAGRWSAVTFDVQHYRAVQEPTWQVPFAAHQPFRTVVFDPPYFDLARAPDVQGLVSWGAHDPGTPRACRPSTLDAEIVERFGEYPAKPWIYGFTWTSVERTEQMGRGLVQATRQRAEIARWLLADRLPDWSLGIVVVSEPHSAVEALWHGVDPNHRLHGVASADAARRALEAVYEAVDELLGTLAGSFPDCALAVFSMHGMGPNSADVPAMALLPEYLYRRAFGRTLLGDGDEDPVPTLLAAGATSWTPHVQQRWRGAPVAAARKRQSRLSRLAARLRHSGDERRGDDVSLAWMPAAWYARYWPQMTAFAMPAFYDGQIRLNVRGRERHGLVAAEDYDALCDTLTAELQALRDPATGQPVVEEIVRPHPGDPLALHATEADMVVVWRGSPCALVSEQHGTIGPLAPRRPGGHTGGHGLSIWVGDDIRAGDFGVRPSFDVVPTLIEYLTGAADPRVDGDSFARLIRDGAVTAPP